MKQKLMACLIMICALAASALPAQAKTFEGNGKWRVNFTKDEKMDSNFTTADLTELVTGMQPGDDAEIKVSLKNSNSSATNWYMTNEVLSSLEDSVSVASGGAYAYHLSYVGPDGEEDVLFDSDTVGGEDVSKAGEGLNEATNALKDYFYLDNLKSGESGQVTLRVALDGETQGNDYQDTLAKLQMNFAVELDAPATDNGNPSSGGNRTGVVETGERDMLPYLIAAGISGLILLIFAIVSLRERRKAASEERGDAR